MLKIKNPHYYTEDEKNALLNRWIELINNEGYSAKYAAKLLGISYEALTHWELLSNNIEKRNKKRYKISVRKKYNYSEKEKIKILNKWVYLVNHEKLTIMDASDNLGIGYATLYQWYKIYKDSLDEKLNPRITLYTLEYKIDIVNEYLDLRNSYNTNDSISIIQKKYDNYSIDDHIIRRWYYRLLKDGYIEKSENIERRKFINLNFNLKNELNKRNITIHELSEIIGYTNTILIQRWVDTNSVPSKYYNILLDILDLDWK